MVTLADARNASAKPGSVGGDLLVLLSGVAYAVRTSAHMFSSGSQSSLSVLSIDCCGPQIAVNVKITYCGLRNTRAMAGMPETRHTQCSAVLCSGKHAISVARLV